MAFGRVIEVSVGPPGQTGVVIKDLYMTFEAVKGQPQSLNPASVKIYNLGPDVDSRYVKINNLVQIRAGYADEAVLPIFTGYVWKASRVRQQADWITEIQVQDGTAYVFKSPYSCSYGGRAQVKQVITDFVSSTGIPTWGVDNIPLDAYYQNGFSFVGQIAGFLKTVVVGRIGWPMPQIFNQTLYLIDPRNMPQVSAPYLTEETGLLLEPERQNDSMQNMAEQQGASPGSIIQRYKVTTLLMPQINPMTPVKIKSKTFTGTQWVETVRHAGDNRTGDFRSESIVSNIPLLLPQGT